MTLAALVEVAIAGGADLIDLVEEVLGVHLRAEALQLRIELLKIIGQARIDIGDRAVADDQPVVVVAEIGAGVAHARAEPEAAQRTAGDVVSRPVTRRRAWARC